MTLLTVSSVSMRPPGSSAPSAWAIEVQVAASTAEAAGKSAISASLTVEEAIAIVGNASIACIALRSCPTDTSMIHDAHLRVSEEDGF